MIYFQGAFENRVTKEPEEVSDPSEESWIIWTSERNIPVNYFYVKMKLSFVNSETIYVGKYAHMRVNVRRQLATLIAP